MEDIPADMSGIQEDSAVRQEKYCNAPADRCNTLAESEGVQANRCNIPEEMRDIHPGMCNTQEKRVYVVKLFGYNAEG